MAGSNFNFKPVDFITIGYFVVLSTAILSFHEKVSGWYLYILVHLIYIFLIVILAWQDNKVLGEKIKFLHDWYPMFSLPFIYEELGNFVHLVFPGWLDFMINNIEKAIFGVYPTVWLQGIVNPALTEYFKFSYFSYYIVTPLPAIIFYLNQEKERFDEFILALFSAYYISFLGFILFPVEGPRYALKELHRVDLIGYFITSFQDFITRIGALHGGCMPSSHVAAALVSLLAIRSYRKSLYHFLLPIIIPLFFSPIYTRDHYFLDVVAGLLVGWFSWWWVYFKYSKR